MEIEPNFYPPQIEYFSVVYESFINMSHTHYQYIKCIAVKN